jgi:hypothetical protein
MDFKSTDNKSKNRSVGLYQTEKAFAQQGKQSTEITWRINRDNLENGRKYLQIVHLIRSSYSEYVRNSYD